MSIKEVIYATIASVLAGLMWFVLASEALRICYRFMIVVIIQAMYSGICDVRKPACAIRLWRT
jgi:hypothetical protein